MKPSDFFLGVVNFLGVLVPGAVLLLLRGCFSDCWLFRDNPLPAWLIFGGVAYILGQLLLAATEILNMAARWLQGWTFSLGKDVKTFLKDAGEKLPLLEKGSPQSKFHTALSYLRKENAAAAGEVDHHMADYKLLRNLIAVLLIDIPLRWHAGQGQECFLMVEILTLILCCVAFVRMFFWAQLLAYQYVALIAAPGRKTVTSPME